MEIQIKAADPIAPSENGCRKEEMLMRAWNMRSSGALMLGDVNQSIHFFFWNSINVLQKAKNFTNRIFNDSTKNIRFYDKEYRTDV